MAKDEIQPNLIKYTHETHPAVSVINNAVEYVVSTSTPPATVDTRTYTQKDISKSVAPPTMQVYFRDPNIEHHSNNATLPPPPPTSITTTRNGDTNPFDGKRNGVETYRKTIQIENNENENGNGTSVQNTIPVEINQAELTAKEDLLRAQICDGMAYGRLQCGSQILNITEGVVKIGRNSKASKVAFHVSDNTYVSRKHIQIIYDRNNRDFFMLCLSKNGIFMNNEFQMKCTVPIKLSQRCTFRFPSTNILVNFESFIEKREIDQTDAPPPQPVKTKAETLPYTSHAEPLQSNQLTANQTQTFIDNNVGKQANARAPLKINIPQHETGKTNLLFIGFYYPKKIYVS